MRTFNVDTEHFGENTYSCLSKVLNAVIVVVYFHNVALALVLSLK